MEQAAETVEEVATEATEAVEEAAEATTEEVAEAADMKVKLLLLKKIIVFELKNRNLLKYQRFFI